MLVFLPFDSLTIVLPIVSNDDVSMFLTAINIWKEERSTMDIMVDGNRTGQVAGMLHEREIPYSVAIPDVTDLLEKENGSRQSIPRRAYFLIRKIIMVYLDNHHALSQLSCCRLPD